MNYVYIVEQKTLRNGVFSPIKTLGTYKEATTWIASNKSDFKPSGNLWINAATGAIIKIIRSEFAG